MKLSVMLLTYSPSTEHPRAEYARRTLVSTLSNLQGFDWLHVHIADDGSPPEHREQLIEIANNWTNEVTVSDSQRRGYGANYNGATMFCHERSDFILPLEDDWELTRELRVDEYARALEEGYGCIRLGYVGWTQRLFGEFVYAGGKQYIMLDPASPERHVFSGHPRLETRDFERRVGLWPEGLDPGATEFAVSGYPEARAGILWPLDVRAYGDLFAHIGTVQARTDQGETVNAP